jgi:hypothetical protein
VWQQRCYDPPRLSTLTVPQQAPALFATGNAVARCSCSFCRAFSTGSFSVQHADRGRMTSLTGTSEARRSSAAVPQHTSRSVTTPTSLRWSLSSTTGAQPQPESRIARAASAAVSCGVQHDDVSIGSSRHHSNPHLVSFSEGPRAALGNRNDRLPGPASSSGRASASSAAKARSRGCTTWRYTDRRHLAPENMSPQDNGRRRTRLHARRERS